MTPIDVISDIICSGALGRKIEAPKEMWEGGG